MLTQKRLKELVHYNPDTGLLVRRIARGGKKAGEIMGRKRVDGYLDAKIDGDRYLVHRLAFLYMEGDFPEEQTDHRNRIKTDNRFVNLISCTQSVNQKNRDIQANNKSGIAGVRWKEDGKRWTAYIASEGKQIHLYSGKDFFEACCARKSAENKYGFHKSHRLAHM